MQRGYMYTIEVIAWDGKELKIHHPSQCARLLLAADVIGVVVLRSRRCYSYFFPMEN